MQTDYGKVAGDNNQNIPLGNLHTFALIPIPCYYKECYTSFQVKVPLLKYFVTYTKS